MPVIDVRGDAQCVWDVLQAGGVAIIPLDVAYANVAQTPDALARIYRAKGRSVAKPSGMFGSYELMRDIHLMGEREREIVAAVTQDYDLPFSIVAPFRADHPFFAKADPRLVAQSSKAGTLDMLMNAGPIHDEIARLSLAHQFPVFGNSANRSLSGSKFRLEDIESEVRAVADVEIDYGLCRYANDEGVSSTIVAFPKFEVLRYGCCYAQIRDIFQRHFHIELPPKPVGETVMGAARG